MNRFAKGKRNHAMIKELALPIFLFVMVLVLFGNGLRSITTVSENEQLKSARQAITRAAVHCYAVEGAYPPDLAYLEESYGLQINYDKYIVDYRCFASNLMPDITVLPKTAKV
ncbi:hypothetical protein V6615_00535 [Oscillospiraceae bacterium PP1C4]